MMQPSVPMPRNRLMATPSAVGVDPACPRIGPFASDLLQEPRSRIGTRARTLGQIHESWATREEHKRRLRYNRFRRGSY